MNPSDPQPVDPQRKAQSFELLEAIFALYAALGEVKRMVGEGRSRPKAILGQLDALRAQLDTVYTQTSWQLVARKDLAEIIAELQRAYDELLSDTETAYAQGFQAGWDEAHRVMLIDSPGDSGDLVEWLVQALQSPSQWRTPEWERVMDLIREARRYLAANSAE